MSTVLTEVAVQRLVQYGVAKLRQDEAAFREIFSYLVENPVMARGYGKSYVDRIWQWFTTQKIRTVHSWILSPQTIPCYSIHLSTDNENENYAAINDYYGEGEEGDIGVAAMNVMVDIGMHASKAADEVLWMYYILSHILFKYKDVARYLGIEIHTYSASDWQKEASKMPENIWTRWVRMRCSVWNTWAADAAGGPFDIEWEGITFERVEDTNG